MNAIFIYGDLLDVGGGVLLVDRLGGDGAPPPDWLHDVGGQRRLDILLTNERRALTILTNHSPVFVTWSSGESSAALDSLAASFKRIQIILRYYLLFSYY